jgi:hypothetical protein
VAEKRCSRKKILSFSAKSNNTTTQFHNGRCADCQRDPALPASGLECRQGLQTCWCSVCCHPAERGACWPALPGPRSSQASQPHLLGG